MHFNGHGIAAIVGPNGCGKSNLSDAISWVLGEQSAKSLRGTRMDDVIFAGTRDRKPVGMASVTMTLVDPDVHSDTAGPHKKSHNGSNGKSSANGRSPGEVTITRRLFRSGESEYLIDGRPARLRDIQDIFMGVGLGPESYAVIEQGRIGQILSSKPQDRRAVIEEAAGITKFKVKRRLAEVKLEGARQNLTRVFDILEEVGRQVNSLRRQASKAKRYEELKTELTSLARKLLSGRYLLLEREATKTALDLNLADAEFQAAVEAVSKQEAEEARLQEQNHKIERELSAARQRVSELSLEAERARGILGNQIHQIGSIDQRMKQGEKEQQDLDAHMQLLEKEVEDHCKRTAQMEEQLTAARLALASSGQEREKLQRVLGERERAIESSRQAVLRLLGEASALKNQLAQMDEYLAGIERETAKARKEEEAAVGELEWIESSRKEVTEKLALRRREIEELGEQRQGLEKQLAECRFQVKQTRHSLDALRAEFSTLSARKDSLEEILSHRAYTTEAVKRLFTAAQQGEFPGLRLCGVLADFVEVDPAYEKAAEEFLHEELEYVVVQTWSEAEDGVDLLRKDLDGRATFLVHPSADTVLSVSRREEPPIGPETGIVVRLSDVIHLTNGLSQAPAELLPRLARCFVTEDRAAARRLAGQYPGLFFLAPDGVCYHGQAVSGGKKTGSGPLALKRELRELTASVKAKWELIDAASSQLEKLERDVRSYEEELEAARATLLVQEKEGLALAHELRKLEEEFSRAQSRLSVARLELGRLAQERERTTAQRTATAANLDEKEKRRLAEEQVLEQARASLVDLQAEVNRLAEAHAAARAELAGLEERVRASQAARRACEQQHSDLSRRRQDLVKELERLASEKTRLQRVNVELDQRIQGLAKEIQKAEETASALVVQEDDLRARVSALGEEVKQLRHRAQEAQDRRAKVELELVKRQAELKFLDETSRKDLGLPIEQVSEGAEFVAEERELAETEQKYQEVKERVEALGPVNPQALEEYEEAKQRYDFLNTQRQDLLDSIRDTEKAIQEIDVESRKRFSEAFEAINGHFREMFKILFGGGVAEMRLTDENNIGESGIEVVASPPGKRLQNVLLLSGGEKALTALALLIAVFKYQPSPFCVMDEVDAPLDDANIRRLTQLLKQMSSQTQFILITHTKPTMEAAQVLYGVTMEEPGVSKLVSVRFEHLPPPAPWPVEPAISEAHA